MNEQAGNGVGRRGQLHAFGVIVAVTCVLTMGASAGATTPGALSAADFVENADEICEKAQRKLERQGEDDGGQILYANEEVPIVTSKSLLAHYDKVATGIDGTVKSLKKLKPAKSDKVDVADLLDVLGSQAEGYHDAFKLVKRGEGSRAAASRALTNASAHARDARDLAADLGLEVCAAFGPDDLYDNAIEIEGIGAVALECATVSLGAEGFPETFEEAACEGPHNAEAFAGIEQAFWPQPYPGEDEVHATGDPLCGIAFIQYVGTSINESELDYTDLSTGSEGWDDGQRDITCLLFTDDAHLLTAPVPNANP